MRWRAPRVDELTDSDAEGEGAPHQGGVQVTWRGETGTPGAGKRSKPKQTDEEKAIAKAKKAAEAKQKMQKKRRQRQTRHRRKLSLLQKRKQPRTRSLQKNQTSLLQKTKQPYTRNLLLVRNGLLLKSALGRLTRMQMPKLLVARLLLMARLLMAWLAVALGQELMAPTIPTMESSMVTLLKNKVVVRRVLRNNIDARPSNLANFPSNPALGKTQAHQIIFDEQGLNGSSWLLWCSSWLLGSSWVDQSHIFQTMICCHVAPPHEPLTCKHQIH